MTRFKNLTKSQADEDAYNIVEHRNLPKPSGMTASVAHMVKGALGAGILSGHVAYMKAGCGIALITSVLMAAYMTYCLWILVKSAQILYKRTRVPYMTYPDVGEASFACSKNQTLRKWAKSFRFTIDIIICLDLYGSCACYQIIIAKSIKQLVEDALPVSISLRVYLAVMIVPCVLICLLRHLQWLAPFSILANFFILLCIILTIRFAFENNPKFEKLTYITDVSGFFSFCGMTVFSMSCAGVVISIENNMKNPDQFTPTLLVGMCLIVLASVSGSLFGYVAFLDDCESPITVNFPMTLFSKILKGCIAVMIYVTHALNFWVPFNLTFHYLKNLHPTEKQVIWELIYRASFVILIGLVAIAFPNIDALIGFLGTFCLSNMAFIWPNVIALVVFWDRPGFGAYHWRLWRGIVFIIIGLILFSAGTYVSAISLFQSVNSVVRMA